MSTTKLLRFSPSEHGDRKGNVIFIHGLGGSPKGTWHPEDREDDSDFWISWLGTDFPDLGFWSLGYEVEPFAWRGQTMPLIDRATNILDILENYELHEKPLIFVAHSMGGLLVKQILRNACDYGNPSWKLVVSNTKGVVYLSTPHLGSDLANLISNVNLLQPSVSVEELRMHQPQLRDLNEVYRNRPEFQSILNAVYYETKKTKKVLIVDPSSANPGIAGVQSIPVGEDHLSICRPTSKDSQVYMGVKKFIKKAISHPVQLSNIQKKHENMIVQGNYIGSQSVIEGSVISIVNHE
jgi:pimeloyl-ACP methyl ester carboxylesterase